TADLDDDGRLDLVTAARGDADECYTIFGSVKSFLGWGAGGTFLTSHSLPAGVSPDAIAAGDFDGDGRADVAVGHVNEGPYASDGIFVIAGGSIARTLLAGTDVGFLATADLDGDGRLDLAATEDDPDSIGGDSIVLLFGAGSYDFPDVRS